MPRRLVTPDFCSDTMIGRTALGEPIRRLRLNVAPCRRCLAGAGRIAELGALQFARGEGGSGAFRDLPPLLLGQCRVEVQHEGIGIRSEFGHDEWHALRHQAGNEGHVAREAIELGNKHRTLRLARCGQRCGKLWPSIKRIGAFAGFDLGELREERDALGSRQSARLPFVEPPGRAPIDLGVGSRLDSRRPHFSWPILRVFKPQTTVCCLLTRVR